MKVVKPKSRLRGEQPKLKPKQEAHVVELHAATATFATIAGEEGVCTYARMDIVQRRARS
jgi:hypothetical protein